MTGHAAARGQNAGGDFHAVNIFRSSFGPHQDDRIFLAAVPSLLHRFIRGKHNLTDGRARGRRQAGGKNFDLRFLLIQSWHEEVIKLVGFDAEDGFFFCDQSLVHHLNGDTHRGQPGALSIARLEHVQLAFLDGELKILHVAIMLLEPGRNFAELPVNVRHDFLQFENWHRRANARDNILALRVHKEFAVEFFVAHRGITGEAHARAAGLAQIAKDHCLYVDRGSEHVINVVDAAIMLGPIVLP